MIVVSVLGTSHRTYPLPPIVLPSAIQCAGKLEDSTIVYDDIERGIVLALSIAGPPAPKQGTAAGFVEDQATASPSQSVDAHVSVDKGIGVSIDGGAGRPIKEFTARQLRRDEHIHQLAR